MTIVVDLSRWAGILVVCLLSTGATNQTIGALYGDLTAENIERVLAVEEVERFTNGTPVQLALLDLQAAAWFEGDIDLNGVDEWLGLEFAEGFDDESIPTGNTLTISIIDLVDVDAANARFDELRDQVLLVESEQGIGDRFAGLSPQVAGLHTLVLFLEGDKVVLMTTTTREDMPDPLVSSEGLVDLARIAAPRFER